MKPTAPAAGREYVFRCTTAGTSGASEPTWSGAIGNNSTIASGGATFTNVTGQSAYGWSAAAGTAYCISAGVSGRPANGDRVFIASDHSETNATSSVTYSWGSAGYALIQVISVNRAGSVPPVAADITSGATIANSGAGSFNIDALTNIFYQGVTFSYTSTGNGIVLGSANSKAMYFKNCTLAFTNAGASSSRLTTGVAGKWVFDNTAVQFSHVSQSIGTSSSGPAHDLTWINTASPLAGSTFPTALFTTASAGNFLSVVCRGVDFSSLTGTLLQGHSGGWQGKVLLDSCKIASGLTRYAANGGAGAGVVEEVELVNCYDGTNVLNERYTASGAVTTDRSTTLSGGAQDDVAAYSLKLVSSSRSDKSVFTLDSFWLDVENTLTGSSKTATVEIISSGSLNDNDISLLLEYMGTSGASVAGFVSSLPAVLATGSALPTSTVTWNNPPATPVKQKLQVTFTPQRAGRLRGLVRLGKASATCWINPQIAIT